MLDTLIIIVILLYRALHFVKQHSLPICRLNNVEKYETAFGGECSQKGPDSYNLKLLRI